MGQAGAPFKTAEGQQELATRARRLGQRHRTVLLLVDGRRGEAEVRALAQQAGVSPTLFDELLEAGLIDRPVAQLLPPVATLPPAGADAAALDGPDDSLLDTALQPLPPVGSTLQPDSVLLPAARTLQPETTLHGELAAPVSLLPDEEQDDPALEEAREMLARALRSEAPVAGTLTLLRIKRARDRAGLAALLDDVEQRIRKPHRILATQVLMQRVRALIATPTLPR